MSEASARPDIVLILTDNQQAATLGCYGNTETHTPNLDRLAEQGLLFENAFCPNAFCSPCRASVLTGKMPSQHGIHAWLDDRRSADWPQGWHALAGHKTLPELLQGQGYKTGLFGKYHLGDPRSPAPGWDAWVTMADGHVRSFYDNAIYEAGETYPQPGHATDFFTDKALTWMAAQSGPSFAYLPLPSPYGHWPATRDGNRNRFSALYDDCPGLSVPRCAVSAEAVARYDQVKAQSGRGLDYSMLLRAPNDLATLRNYYSQITLIDAAVGRIMDAMPDALIVFTADHGLSLGHHGFWGHGAATYPSNMHLAAHSVPLLMRWPRGAQAGGRSAAMVSNLDLFATLLDCAGGVPDPALPSQSLRQDMQGQASLPLRDVVFAEQEETRVIRTADWLYFKRVPDTGLTDALFDLRADPGETANLVDDLAHRDVAQQLSTRIDTYFAQYSQPEADLWRGGRAIQNATQAAFWRDRWGADWSPVFSLSG